MLQRDCIFYLCTLTCLWWKTYLLNVIMLVQWTSAGTMACCRLETTKQSHRCVWCCRVQGSNWICWPHNCWLQYHELSNWCHGNVAQCKRQNTDGLVVFWMHKQWQVKCITDYKPFKASIETTLHCIRDHERTMFVTFKSQHYDVICSITFHIKQCTDD